MFDWHKFLRDVAQASRGDYSAAFKMLGVVLYVERYGVESLFSGKLVNQRTAYRWLETIQASGWGLLLTEAKVLRAIQEHLESMQQADAEAARDSLSKLLVATADGQEVVRHCPHCQAAVRRADEWRGQCPSCGGGLVFLIQQGVADA